MTGRTPHRRRRWWGRGPGAREQEAAPGREPSDGESEDERGRQASLGTAGTADAAETPAAAPAPAEQAGTGAQRDDPAPRAPERAEAAQQASPGPWQPSPAEGTDTVMEKRPDRQPAEQPAEPQARHRMTAVREGVRKSGSRLRAAIYLLADRVIELAPRIPVRDLATLRRQFPGLTPEQLADKLVAGAVHGTATVGAGIGAAAMLPVPPAMPTELAAEVTGVAAIELKLVAELYEVYGRRPPGGLKERSVAYLTSWADERGIDVAKPWTLNNALGGQMKRELRQQITKRLMRNLPSLTPFMVGAAVGAVMNRRDTRRLAARVRDDLRRHQVPWEDLPQLPPLEKPADALPLGRLPGEANGSEPQDRALGPDGGGRDQDGGGRDQDGGQSEPPAEPLR